MDRTTFEMAQAHFTTVERCEKALVELGLGKGLVNLINQIPKEDLLRYIESGLEYDLDMARDELNMLGVEV